MKRPAGKVALLLTVTCIFLVSSCANPSRAPAPTSAPSATLPPTPTPAATITSSPSPSPSPSTVSLQTPRIDTLVSGLEVPWAIDFAPDGRIFATERPGRIRIIKDGQLQAEPWMTLDVASNAEGGLLGLAIDPAFSQNRYIYVAHTYQSSGKLFNRLVRLREDPSTGKGTLDKVLLDGVPGNTFHDGGRVKFGPDGKLYWTTGEAGNSPSTQDMASPNGKILRLNPDGGIPADNPFPGSPVYSYGNRNSQGLAWQPGTGRLYATEHGPSGDAGAGLGQDEVNFIEAGKNYGWPVIHGDQQRAGMEEPIIQSGVSETWAPAGCTFVTGGPWHGSFLFTGLRGETLYRLTLDRADPRRVVSLEKLYKGQYGRLRDVAQGPDGSIYLATSNRDGRGNPRQGDDRILKLSWQG